VRERVLDVRGTTEKSPGPHKSELKERRRLERENGGKGIGQGVLRKVATECGRKGPPRR